MAKEQETNSVILLRQHLIKTHNLVDFLDVIARHTHTKQCVRKTTRHPLIMIKRSDSRMTQIHT